IVAPPRLCGDNRPHGAFGFGGIAVAMRDDRPGKLAVNISLAGDLTGLVARLPPFAAHVMREEKVEVVPSEQDSARPGRTAQDVHAALDPAGTDQAPAI